MKRFMLCAVAALAGAILTSDDAVAQLKPSQDHFESRRRDAEHRAKLREQQAQANRRATPTFTIPQPAFQQPYGQGYYDPRYDRGYYDPRFDRGYRDGGYVFIPGHYQNVYGQLVYVPPHYEYIRR